MITFAWVATPEAWVALITLVAIEIVLGIDNISFISILVARLPVVKINKAPCLFHAHCHLHHSSNHLLNILTGRI
ncbi:MAG: hypothetical protein QNJ17_01300 [Desulfocapsaceae bacterium]|nr:hypothetical protein [Desulfocapsaceae bacterium]